MDNGSKFPPRKSGQPRIPGGDTIGTTISGARCSGAMSQQRGDSGDQSAPQKFVQLVGCSDPKLKPEPWVRPRAPQG